MARNGKLIVTFQGSCAQHDAHISIFDHVKSQLNLTERVGLPRLTGTNRALAIYNAGSRIKKSNVSCNQMAIKLTRHPHAWRTWTMR